MVIKTNEDKNKVVNSLQQSKGQLEASVSKVEPFLDSEDFKDYCDAIYTCVAYQQKIQKEVKEIIISDTNE